MRTVSARLGHANPSTTLGVYSHFVESSDRDAANVSGDIVGDANSAVTKSKKAPVQPVVRRKTFRKATML